MRSDQGEVNAEHMEAMSARCVFIHVKAKLYTAAQKTDQDELGDDDWKAAMAERSKLLQSALI